MENLTQYPLLLFGTAFVALWLAYAAGSWLRKRSSDASDVQNEDIGVILAATLTLRALIIGFSFSMATNRYDQRKNFEEGEANAIGTAVLRADLLPPSDAAKPGSSFASILISVSNSIRMRMRLGEPR